MLLIALRNLFKDRGRLLINVGGVTFSIVLMLSLFGIYNGAIERNVLFFQKNSADIFVLRKGMNDLNHGIPQVSLSVLEQIKSEDGIKKVNASIAIRPSIDYSGTQYSLLVTSFDPSDQAQGPWAVEGGTKNIAENEILIPSGLAHKLNKKVGDTLAFSESKVNWRIAGLVPEASIFGNHFCWINSKASKQFMTSSDLAGFGLVSLKNPNSAVQMAQDLQEKFPSVNVQTKQRLVESGRKNLDESFLPILKAILAISILIGTAILGLILYTTIVDNSKEIGILKAIGLSSRQLYLTVLVQSISTTLMGLLIGCIISLGVGVILINYVDLTFILTARSIWEVIILAICMAILASLVPLKRLSSIDPAEIFKT